MFLVAREAPVTAFLAASFSSLAPPSLAEPAASQPVSASSYRFPKDVGVIAIVVAPLEFRHVEREIFPAHVVERADDPAFQQRPEPINGASVDLAPHIFVLGVVDALMPVVFDHPVVDVGLIGRDQIDLGGNCFPNEFHRGQSINAVDDAGDNPAATLNRAHDRSLSNAAGSVVPIPDMPILVLAADKSLVNFDDPDQLAEIPAKLHFTDLG